MSTQQKHGEDVESRQNRRKETSATEGKGKGTQLTSEEDEPKNLLIVMVGVALGWLTPYEQLVVLRQKKEDKAWERFRDSLMRRWSNLNVIVSGLL